MCSMSTLHQVPSTVLATVHKVLIYFLHWLSISLASSISSLAIVHKNLFSTLVEYFLSFFYKFPGYSTQSTYFLHWLSISWASSMSSMATLHHVLPAVAEYLLSSFYKIPGYRKQSTYFLLWLSISWAPSISCLATVDKVLTFCTNWVFPELPLWAPWLHYNKYTFCTDGVSSELLL
jgi:hypothetical protein